VFFAASRFFLSEVLDPRHAHAMYVNVNYIYIRETLMGITARLDEIGKPAWIALTVLSFILFWPLGFVTLAFLIGSGRMACWKHRGHWRHEHAQDMASRWFAGNGPSGNRAFDAYRSETLQRLEEEQREFKAYIDRLRFAKDKAEFDAFLAERRSRTENPEPPARS
jgi:hypothetical protein